MRNKIILKDFPLTIFYTFIRLSGNRVFYFFKKPMSKFT